MNPDQDNTVVSLEEHNKAESEEAIRAFQQGVIVLPAPPLPPMPPIPPPLPQPAPPAADTLIKTAPVGSIAENMIVGIVWKTKDGGTWIAPGMYRVKGAFKNGRVNLKLIKRH